MKYLFNLYLLTCEVTACSSLYTSAPVSCFVLSLTLEDSPNCVSSQPPFISEILLNEIIDGLCGSIKRQQLHWMTVAPDYFMMII